MPMWTKARKAAAVEAYQRGLSLTAVAEMQKSKRRFIAKALREAGVSQRPPPRFKAGPANPEWKGGVRIDDDGYTYIYKPHHPHVTAGGYVMKQRLLMEKWIGRYLKPEERVAFLDGDRSNFSRKNLKLFPSHGAMLAFLLEGKTPKWTEDGIRRIIEACPHSGGFAGRKRYDEWRRKKPK
jgi:hypothetical protein